MATAEAATTAILHRSSAHTGVHGYQYLVGLTAASLVVCRISAAEAAMMGMRRGRSAHTVEAMPADCGVAIEWRRGRAAGQGSAPSDGGVTDANGRSAAPSAAPTRSPSADPGTSGAQVQDHF